MLPHEHYFYKRAGIFIHVRKDCGKSGKSKSTYVSRNLKKRCLEYSGNVLKHLKNYNIAFLEVTLC